MDHFYNYLIGISTIVGVVLFYAKYTYKDHIIETNRKDIEKTLLEIFGKPIPVHIIDHKRLTIKRKMEIAKVVDRYEIKLHKRKRRKNESNRQS